MSSAACMSGLQTAHRTPERAYDGSPAVVGISLFSSSSAADARLTSGLVDLARGTSENSLAVLEQTPVEVLVQIFQHLDMRSAFSFAATSRHFADVFAANKVSIVLSIVKEEFSPLDGLLQVVKTSPADLALPWGTWLDKRIRRRNVVLCPGGKLPDHCPKSTAATTVSCAEATIEDEDINRLLGVCRVVRGWERIFPQHRFNALPSFTRSLSAHENFRLRRALYNWMRYAYYFHGDLTRPNIFVPSGRDVRINQLRVLPNSQLGELRDLWRTVEDIIELTICPSIDNVRVGVDFELSEKDAARIGWGEQRENRVIVATVSKLAPGELLHYVENGHKYTKVRLIQDIRRRHPRFEIDTESLTSALSFVSLERWRQMQVEFPAMSQTCSTRLSLPVYTRVMGQCRGGVLDWDDPETEEDCVRIGEMKGLGLDWRIDEALMGYRAEIPAGLLYT